MIRSCVLSLVAVLALPLVAAQAKSVVRDGRRVDFIECRECDKLAKWSEDGTFATINISRLRDGDPSPVEYSRRESETVELVFAAMAMAKSPAESPRRIVRSDDVHVISTNATCGFVELAVENLVDSPRDINVELAELGICDPVRVLDMTERAVLADFRGVLAVRVPPRERKVFRLVPATRQQDQRPCCSQ